MDLTELKIFKAVAEQGGITKAAASLHRVQSNVTTRVKQLEERLGAKLFHRQGRKLVLSSEGKVLLAYADRLLRLSSEAHAAVKDQKDIDERTVLAFTTGCSYRRRLESWLGRASVVAERVMEYGSYHAI